MAQRTQVLLIDDLDGSDAAETVTFAIDGVSYEIDLNAKHAAELRSGLDKYLANARRIGRGPGAGSVARPASSRANAGRNAAIRAWAEGQGKKVSDRGRIAADIVQEWEAAGRPGG